MRATLPVFLILLAGCRTGPPEPVEIEASDMCALCRMAISEKQYAAEIIDPDETPAKFDDIACMIRYAKEHGRRRTAAIFAVDYPSRRWIGAASAHYVQSEKIPSPMRGGLIALKDEAEARNQAARFSGRVLAFDDLWK
jgi:copper chaperone NosL